MQNLMSRLELSWLGARAPGASQPLHCLSRPADLRHARRFLAPRHSRAHGRATLAQAQEAGDLQPPWPGKRKERSPLLLGGHGEPRGIRLGRAGAHRQGLAAALRYVAAERASKQSLLLGGRGTCARWAPWRAAEGSWARFRWDWGLYRRTLSGRVRREANTRAMVRPGKQQLPICLSSCGSRARRAWPGRHGTMAASF